MRTGAGTTVSTTIELRRLDRASAATIAIRAVCASGTYTAVTVGEGVYQFSRVYRPKWATISGWALTVGLLGAGYWLLLIKRTEACTMWVSEDRASVRVTLVGGLLADVYERVCQAFDEVEGISGPSCDVNNYEDEAFDMRDDLLAYRAFRRFPTVTREVRPEVIDLTAAERDEIDRFDFAAPDRWSSPFPTVLDLPEVRFETGEQVRVMGVVYVGRDPWHRDANGRAVERLAVDDPTGTVANTHFSMGADRAGLWVEDLFSTTGTMVGVDRQSARRAWPLEHTAVSAGETIFFGDRSARVLESLPVD